MPLIEEIARIVPKKTPGATLKTKPQVKQKSKPKTQTKQKPKKQGKSRSQPNKKGKSRKGNSVPEANTLDGKGSFMKDAHWERLENIRKKRPNPRKEAAEAAIRNKEKEKMRKIAEVRADRRIKRGEHVLPKPEQGFLKSIVATGKTLLNSSIANLSQEGNLAKAGIGILHSSAASAAIHGGLGYLQGDDPWEAAKTGAWRGAFAGVGYQGLKAATHSNAQTIRGNLKQMASTTRQTYKAYTVAGQEQIKKNGMSKQLEKVLASSRLSNFSENFFFGGK